MYMNIWWCPQVHNGFKEYEQKFQVQDTVLKVMKFTSKTRCSHFLLSMSFDVNFCRSHLDNLNLSTWHNSWAPWKTKINKIQVQHHFAITFRPSPKKIMVSWYRSTFLVHFTMLAPFCNLKTCIATKRII